MFIKCSAILMSKLDFGVGIILQNIHYLNVATNPAGINFPEFIARKPMTVIRTKLVAVRTKIS